MAPRTAQTPVFLNVYDLSPANAYVSALGVGLFHSGIEIAGDEYSFASGAGVFTNTPKQAAGAVFCESIELGVFNGSYTEARQLAYSLRPEFEGDSYNLLTKNCNAYSEALCQLLLNKSIPSYVNRAAYFGSFLSCLMPSDVGSQAPVGDTGSSSSSSTRLVNGQSGRLDYSAFAADRIALSDSFCATEGTGLTLSDGSSTSNSSNTNDASTLEDRREKLRQAALRRFESQQDCYGISMKAVRVVGVMGKAAASPAKKGAAGGKAAVNGAREPVRARSFDDSLAVERIERVESTIVNRETATHVAFAKSRKDDFVFVPSPQYVHILNDYCQWDRDTVHSSVLVVISQPGNGKSALLAHWADERRKSEEGVQELIYEHYSGCSYDSVRLSLFLFRFMNQIKTTYSLKDFELPREHEEEKLKFSFGRCLEAAVGRTNHLTGTNSKLKRIILVLDGIDCIRNEDGGDSLSWLPTTFPSNVRIIVSATQTTARGMNHLRCCKFVNRKPFVFDDDEDLMYETSLPPQDHDSHTIRELRRRQSTFIVVEPLDEPSCRAILRLYEEKCSRSLDPDERESIVTSPGSSSPLCVRLLLHALELFESTQDVARKQWLKAACQTNELHVIYEMMMKQWNEILLADLFEQFHKCKASAVDTTHTNSLGTFVAMQSGDGNSNERKLTRRSTKRDVTSDQNSAPDSVELENLQTAIEQRALLVRHTLSLLAVSRYGLSDVDLIKLFGDSVPKTISQQLMKLLRPHLMQIRRHDCGSVPAASNLLPLAPSNNNTSDGVVLLNDLSHNQFRLIIRYGFLRDDYLRNCYYRELANYFEAMEACQRRLDELPVQLERCALWSSLQNSLVDIKMFQLWWGERNRQEFFSYWMVLRNNCSIHDPVDDFIRSLDEYIAHENPTADQLLALFLTITDFLRTWQRIDDSKSGHLVSNRPEPPQLQEFITSVGNFSISHLSDSEARKIQQDIDALCIHAEDGYYVRRWLWTQFPLIGVAFESRFLRNVLASRFPGGANDAFTAGEENQHQAESSGGAGGSNNNNSSTQNPHAADASGSKSGSRGVVLPKAVIGAGDKSKMSPIVKRKPLPAKTLLPNNPSPSGFSSSFDAIPEDDFGAFEFLSPENSEVSLGSVSKLESQLMELRMKYDKLKFTAKEKSDNLKVLESRLLDTKAQAKAAGQSASKMDELLEQIRQVNDETMIGRQRSDYYKSILRHCEVNPARDPNTIESAETIVNKLKQDVVDLQQKTQVVSYEKRLASIEVPKLLQVIQDKSNIHQAALARLRWRQELNHRMTSSLIANKIFAFTVSKNNSNTNNNEPLESGDNGGGQASLGSPVKRQTIAAGGDVHTALGAAGSETNFLGRRTTTTEEASFLRAKDKLLHKKETSAERQKKVESLKQYVGSAYKDDGILGTLRQVGINKPEEAQVYWQDQLDHATQLEAEEKLGEQRMMEYRDKLAALQAHFVNLKLGGSSASSESSLAVLATAAGGQSTGISSNSASMTTPTGGASGGESVSKSHNIKLLEQQLSDTSANNQQKKERAARLKVLSEKLHLGLLHIAQIVGVASAQKMDSLALGDAIEQVVRLFLGDESHLQSSSSTNLRRKNSARVMGLASQAGSHPLLPLGTRTADDKIRYNVRVLKSQKRSMNPYVDTNSDEESDSDNESNASERTTGSADGVKRRQDIKNRSKMELHKKETEKKRAEKKRK